MSQSRLIAAMIQQQLSRRTDGCVEIKDVVVDTKAMKKICAALNETSMINTVIFSNTGINDVTARPLLDLVRNNKHITKIDFLGDKVGFEIEHELAEILLGNQRNKLPPTPHNSPVFFRANPSIKQQNDMVRRQPKP